VTPDPRRPGTSAVETSAGEPGDPAVRVLVLTAPVAEGHVATARALSEQIQQTNDAASVTVFNVLSALPRPLRWLLNDAYRWQLRAAPWMFAALFGALRRSRLLRSLARSALSLAGSRALLAVIRRYPADVIVSTWPAATTILGCLRLRGKVRVPVCAAITDFAGLELWADRGVDLHLVMHESLVPTVERVAGRGSAQVVSPLVSSAFRTPRSAAAARRSLGLQGDAMVIVVSGGGWAVGDLDGAIRAAIEIDGASVVCLAGRDDAIRARLEETFQGERSVTVLEFTEKMSELLVAADVLVHSTGGVTCLEALACGCPIVAYGAPPGHAPVLAREMSALGLVAHARSAAELRAALVSARTRPRVTLGQGVDAAVLVLTATPRVAARLRARLARTAALASTLALAFFVLFASDLTYPVIAEALALPDSTSISPAPSTAPLIIRGNRRDLLALAAFTRRDHVRASVALSEAPTRREVSILRAAGLEPIPELRERGFPSIFKVEGQLRSELSLYGVAEPFYFLAPKEGFTIGDYLFARHIGGVPIQAGYVLPAKAQQLGRVHVGEVVVATIGSEPGRDRAHLLTWITRLAREGITVSSVPSPSSRQLSP
jgi:processive 1,2-diacylglycerol beta-glucosyltransferase